MLAHILRDLLLVAVGLSLEVVFTAGSELPEAKD